MTTHESFLIFITLSYLIYISLGAVTGFVFGVDCGVSQFRREAIERGFAEHANDGEWRWKGDGVE
jgi:hypothetical protein